MNKLLGDNLVFKVGVGEIEQKVNEKFALITFWDVLGQVANIWC